MLIRVLPFTVLLIVLLIVLSSQVIAQPQRGFGRRPGRPGGRNREGNLKVGDKAPDFELALLASTPAKTIAAAKKGDSAAIVPAADSKRKPKPVSSKDKAAGGIVKLSAHKGKLPVVLIFGSYT